MKMFNVCFQFLYKNLDIFNCIIVTYKKKYSMAQMYLKSTPFG